MPFLLGPIVVLLVCAVALYWWLCAVSFSRYYPLILALATVFPVAWLVIGFTCPIKDVIPDAQAPGTPLCGVLWILLVIPAWLRVPMPVVAIIYGVPFLAAIILAAWSPRRARDVKQPYEGRLLLGGGFAVYALLVALVASHGLALATRAADTARWKAYSGRATYRQGKLVELSFHSTERVPWDWIVAETDLEILALTKCRVSDADLEKLVGLSRLLGLKLDETEVSDACIPTLEKLPSLRNVSIYRTRITPEGAQRLRQKFEPQRVGYEPSKPQKRERQRTRNGG